MKVISRASYFLNNDALVAIGGENSHEQGRTVSRIWERIRTRWQRRMKRQAQPAPDEGLMDATRLVLDESEYLRRHPDVARSGASALQHFVHHGHSEGRLPGNSLEPGFLHRTESALSALPGNRHVQAWHLRALLEGWAPERHHELEAGWMLLVGAGMPAEEMSKVVGKHALLAYRRWRGGVSAHGRGQLQSLVNWCRSRLPVTTELELAWAAWRYEAGDLSCAATTVAALDLPEALRQDMEEVVHHVPELVASAHHSLTEARQLAAQGDRGQALQALWRAGITRLDADLLQETADAAHALGDGDTEANAKFDLARIQGQVDSDSWRSLIEERSRRLLLLDTAFPSPISPFRLGEFAGYLQTFPQCVARIRFDHQLFRFGKGMAFPDEVEAFTRQHAIQMDRISHLLQHTDLTCKLAYTVFVNQADQFFLQTDLPARKLAFTLYPGGGFELGGERSDRILRRLFDDPRLERVITTQRTSYEYLVNQGFCREDRICHIYGGLVPTAMHPPEVNFEARAHRRQSRPMNICFVAHRYTATGAEKGYDVLVAVMKALSQESGIHFHIVGGYDRSVLDLGNVKHVTFHGPQPASFFNGFYEDMDIILSPNAALSTLSGSGVGSFDGFPTGAVLEAGLHGVAMFMSDVMGMNRHLNGQPIFVPNEDAVIIDRQVDQIVSAIRHHLDHPDALQTMARKGRDRLLQHFSKEAQMQPRFELMTSMLN